MKKRLSLIICIVLMVASQSGIGGTLYYAVTSGTTSTMEMGEMPSETDSTSTDSMVTDDSSSVPDLPSGDNSDTSLSVPELPDGENSDDSSTPPDLPDGESSSSDSTVPEKPSGDSDSSEIPTDIPDNSN